MMETKIYQDLVENHLGKENGISRGEYAQAWNISKRELRRITEKINGSVEYEKLVSTTSLLYVCANEEECKKSIRTTFRQAISLILKGRAMQKKVKLDGQIKFEIENGELLVVETIGGENDKL